MKERLVSIAENEGCSLDLVDDILHYADGDMRRAVMTLQSVHALTSSGENVITKDDIAEIAGLAPKRVVDDLWATLSSEGCSFDKMQAAVDEFMADGYSAQVLLASLLEKVTADQTLNEVGKAEMAIRMAESEKNMIEGADEYLQLMDFCSLAIECFGKSTKPTN